MADLIGQQISHYRILRHLGAGGMATTYVAVDTRLAYRQVTIEISPIHSNEQLQRKELESRILAQLDHLNILPTFDFGREAELFYIVNEYIPEGTLRRRHPIGTRVPLTTVISYAKQVAAALQYVHDRGIIHRDVKPENMFIHSDGRVVLGDFGIAWVPSDEDSGEQTARAGTLKYIAPEQLQGRPQLASDQYSLGIVVYEWLSGRAPFDGTALEVMQKQLYLQPPSLRTIVPQIPPEVDEVVHIALAKDPKERFVHVKAFANALEQASRSLPQGQSSTNYPEAPGTYNADDLVSGAAAWDNRDEKTSQSNIPKKPTHRTSGSPPNDPHSTHTHDDALATGSIPQLDSGLTSGELLSKKQPPTGYSQRAESHDTRATHQQSQPIHEDHYEAYHLPEQQHSPHHQPGEAAGHTAKDPSIFSNAGQTLSKFFSGRGGKKLRDTELSLFAIARTDLEQDDQAIVGNTYTVEAGISQRREEHFRSAPFKVSVQDPLRAIPFHILFHPSENMELVGTSYQLLSYNPGNAEPQFISCQFRLKAPSQSYLLVNFYRERQWLTTMRFEFAGIEQPKPSAAIGGR